MGFFKTCVKAPVSCGIDFRMMAFNFSGDSEARTLGGFCCCFDEGCASFCIFCWAF